MQHRDLKTAQDPRDVGRRGNENAQRRSIDESGIEGNSASANRVDGGMPREMRLMD
jgi:hypothetical protein